MKVKLTERNRHFVETVKQMVSDGHTTYIEAIAQYCTTNNIDPVNIKRLIPKSLREKIEMEAIQLNYIKSNVQEIPDV